MNILIGKIGQKIIFNRGSKNCDRSNTNGNVGTYLLIRLLVENSKDDTFFIASDNDLSSFRTKPFDNVVDVSNMTWDYINTLNIDAMFFLTGLTQFETSNRLFDVINNVNAKLILLSDDPRCLDSVESDNRIKKYPECILSQFKGHYNFKNKIYNVIYVPIEKASCYRGEICCNEKTIDMMIISNTSGKEYDRVKIISDIINGVENIDIYGRLSDDERKILGINNCKGEIKYTEMQSTLSKAYSTFMVPIKKDWVTSKYVEALMNGVLPIFHEDYNTSLLGFKDLIIVHDKEDFECALEYVRNNKDMVKELTNEMIKLLIEPYIDGHILSDILMCYAVLCKNRKDNENEYN